MQSERGIKMKIKKLWLMVLTMVFAVMLSTLAYCETTASGTCGEKLNWTLTDDGTLTISGTGDMGNYVPNEENHFSYTTPWVGNSTSIKTVIIGNGVTSIGDYAFCDCYGLTSIEISSSVTSIGDYAFYDCYGLTSVKIPSSVTSIGSRAFYNCTGLTSVEILSGVTSIGSYAFDSCTGLTSVKIPSSVTSIRYCQGSAKHF
jgi:hypothetical protein